MIVSGGQTGVDRAALDAALYLCMPCGGWCPESRQAEDGQISGRYPLTGLPVAGYLARTLKNVEDSDATLIVAFDKPTGGTARTLEHCVRIGKPHLVIDGAITTPEQGARQALACVREYAVGRLNVAGPRASGEPRGYAFAFELVHGILCMT